MLQRLTVPGPQVLYLNQKEKLQGWHRRRNIPLRRLGAAGSNAPKGLSSRPAISGTTPGMWPRVLRDGPLDRERAGIVAKGVVGWTLGQGKGRNRGQGCRGMDPWAGKGPESCPSRPFETLRFAQGDILRVTGSG